MTTFHTRNAVGYVELINTPAIPLESYERADRTPNPAKFWIWAYTGLDAFVTESCSSPAKASMSELVPNLTILFIVLFDDDE